SRIFGTQAACIRAGAEAQLTSDMSDVMLSLDLTGSMELSGTQDLAHLQQAVAGFINQINPSTSNPSGPKIGMARFAGIMCKWNRANATDQYINLSPISEYVGPCTDDKTVLSNLTQNKAALLKLADNSGPAACPAGMTQYACPLVSWKYVAPVVAGRPPGVPQGLS